MITQELLQKCFNMIDTVASVWAPILQTTCTNFEITTPRRQAAFLAQVGVESASFSRLAENLNYTAHGLLVTFPTHFNAAEANLYAHKKEMMANKAYANRFGNGSEQSGDGWKFKGRGLIQITFKDNYVACGTGLGIDLVSQPELLELKPYAALSAGWYWKTHGCNTLADSEDFRAITKAINGGLNGEDLREASWALIRKEMGL